MNTIDQLTELFEHFPGIGPRQARRFVHYLLSERQSYRTNLSDMIRQLGSQTNQCKQCFRWFVKDDASSGLCFACANPSRNARILFLVEKDADIENVERSGFRGHYFVLGGTIQLASEEPEKYIRLAELMRRVETDGERLSEIILGFSATTEGDHTRLIVQEKLRPLAERFNFKLSSLGRGLSTGSELEYADPDTIASAMSSRR